MQAGAGSWRPLEVHPDRHSARSAGHSLPVLGGAGIFPVGCLATRKTKPQNLPMAFPPSNLPAGLGARVHHRELRPQHLAGRGRGHLRGKDRRRLRGAAGAGEGSHADVCWMSLSTI